MKDHRKGNYLYLTIYKELKAQILDGKYQKGDPFPSERILKDQFGTTHVTIRNALSLLVEEGYIERYSGKGTTVVYSPDTVSLTETVPLLHKAETASERRLRVCLLVPSADSLNLETLNLLSRECMNRSMQFLLYLHHNEQPLEEETAAEILADKNTLLLYEPSSYGICKFVSGFREDRVLILNSIEQNSLHPHIQQDFIKGALDVLHFLDRLGYKEVAYVDWEGSYRGVKLYEGYLKGLGVLKKPGIPGLRANGMGLLEGGYDACRRILTDHPGCRAFLCANDLSAGGVLNCLKENSLSPETDFTVIGCGNDPFSEVLGLSSIDMNYSRRIQILRSIVNEFYSTGKIGNTSYDVKTDLILRDYISLK